MSINCQKNSIIQIFLRFILIHVVLKVQQSCFFVVKTNIYIYIYIYVEVYVNLDIECSMPLWQSTLKVIPPKKICSIDFF